MREDKFRQGFLRASNFDDGMTLLLLGVVVHGLLLLSACGPELPPKCGMVTISLEGGGDLLYLRRMARGLNYDQIVLSAKPDPCLEGDPNTDLVFSGIAPFPVFLEFKNATLHVSSYTAIENPAVSSIGSIPIEYHYLGNREGEAILPLDAVRVEVQLELETSLTVSTSGDTH